VESHSRSYRRGPVVVLFSQALKKVVAKGAVIASVVPRDSKELVFQLQLLQELHGNLCQTFSSVFPFNLDEFEYLLSLFEVWSIPMADDCKDRLSIRTSPHIEGEGDRDAIDIKIVP
jgi:hypothetical protein